MTTAGRGWILPPRFLLTAGIFGALLTLGYILLPDSREIFYEEDELVENLTAGFYLLAACLCFSEVIFGTGRRAGDLSTRPSRWRRLWIGILGVLAMIGAGEELSWGERHVGFEAARVGGTKFDAIHDIGEVIARELGAVVLGSLVVGVILGTLALLWFARHWRPVQYVNRALADHAALRLLVLAIGLLVMAMFIDEGVIPYFRGSIFVEECGEMMAALAVLFASLELTTPPAARFATRQRAFEQLDEPGNG